MTSSVDYSESEWQASAGHHPLSTRSTEDWLLIYRHWLWANQQREAFDRVLEEDSLKTLKPDQTIMISREAGFMFVWYGLLWAVVEACIDPKEGRNIDLRGPFRADIDGMAYLLRRCRNAILHVPRSGDYLDARIQDLVSDSEAATKVRRIHRAFGRLLLAESKRREGEVLHAGTDAATDPTTSSDS